MMLPALILILIAGGLLALLLGRWSGRAARIVSLIATAADLAAAVWIWAAHYGSAAPADRPWIAEFRLEWIPQFGISAHLAMDGLSLIMAALTAGIGLVSVLCSWNEARERTGFFHFNVLWTLAGIMGVFLAVDLFLFYFFWELMLVPMYLLIGIWGHENRGYASMKFFIFTQAGGLIMFIAILGLYFINGVNTGVYTFDYMILLKAVLEPAQARILMAGFLAAFMVKLPAVPFHNWLPDAHTEAPAAGSVILAGLLLKTGAYGILRFIIPLFRSAAVDFQYIAMAIGAAGIIYGAKLAYAQSDLKRLVAYTSVSHMGFVMVGAFAMNELALQGVVLQMVCHAISTGALFILAGALQERLHTRDMGMMGGFWRGAPRMGGMALVFALASLGLPGMGNFIAEFLVLAGSFQVNVWITVFASIGFVISAVYSLAIIQKIFHGGTGTSPAPSDLSPREITVLGAMAAVILYIGVFPQIFINTAAASLQRIRVPEIRTDANTRQEIEKSDDGRTGQRPRADRAFTRNAERGLP